MRRDRPDKLVTVCRWNGRDDRFFGKFKYFGTQEWVKIPGGVFPAEFDTRPKAMIFAETWYATELARRSQPSEPAKPPADPTWSEICDAYIAEVRARMRGKPSTRHEAITITNASIRGGVLAKDKPSDNDEARCLDWLRHIATENIARKKGEQRRRKPMTVRNIAKHLRYLFRFAIGRKMIPGVTANPMKGDEIGDELRALAKTVGHREWLVPKDSLVKLVSCGRVRSERRIAYLVLGLTGLRPGELAGLQFRHLVQHGGACFLNVEQQCSEARAALGGGGITTLKTRWSQRMLPLHRALHRSLAEWVTSGWVAWVGREPTLDDFVFPSPEGAAHRQMHAGGFRRDLKEAGCPTSYAGENLSPYALRHLFSTLLAEAHVDGGAHDRLLGHRPGDTKSLNYTAQLLPFLADEIERVVFELPDAAPSFGVSPPASLVTSLVSAPPPPPQPDAPKAPSRGAAGASRTRSTTRRGSQSAGKRASDRAGA